jgi:hypothetical protein
VGDDEVTTVTEQGNDERIRGRQRAQLARRLRRSFEQDAVAVLSLAQAFGRRPSTVRRLLREAGARGDDVNCVGYTDDEVRVAVVGRFRRGVPVCALRHDTGIDERALRKVLQDAGEQLQEHGVAPTGHAVDMRSGYEQGSSIRVVAAEAGCSYGVARRVLLRAGVTLRPEGGRQGRPPSG